MQCPEKYGALPAASLTNTKSRGKKKKTKNSNEKSRLKPVTKLLWPSVFFGLFQTHLLSEALPDFSSLSRSPAGAVLTTFALFDSTATQPIPGVPGPSGRHFLPSQHGGAPGSGIPFTPHQSFTASHGGKQLPGSSGSSSRWVSSFPSAQRNFVYEVCRGGTVCLAKSSSSGLGRTHTE
jgi:hypothetical protein